MHNEQNIALTFALYDGQNLVRRQTVSQDIIKLGSGATANVRIEDTSVARMHCVVEAQDTDEVTLIDLGNQTRVNGAAVNKCKLSPGDEIELGTARLVVENIEHAAARRVAEAKPFVPEKANPFLGKAAPMFTPFATDEVADDAPEGTYEYRMVPGDAPSPADVETEADGAEVKISWGTNLLHVEHIDADESFYAGETSDKKLRCNYFIPVEKLGTSRAPFVVGGSAVLLPGAKATVKVEGEPAMTAEEAIARGLAKPCAEVAGAHALPLRNGMTVKLQLDDVIVEVRGVKKARKVAAAFTMAAVAGGALLYILGSAFGHAGLLAAMAAFMPPLGATADDDISDDQRYLVKQYLEAAAENEHEPKMEELLTEVAENSPSGGTGTAAKGEGGKMGSETSKNTVGRYAIEGDSDNPMVAKQRALQDAANFGMIGLLNNGMGSKDEPIAPWGAMLSEGPDPLSADGNMWGPHAGDAFGYGGLGLTGLGEGGDGYGEGIGLGSIGTIGHGSGDGCLTCQGFGNGNSSSFLRRGHQAKAPNPIRSGEQTLSGRLPPEVIQRVVRANFGRYRACYQSALKTNPNLQGRVVVNFVISRSGTVSSVSGGGDLPNQGVISCVAGAFGGLTFPQPEHGIVTVSYPLVFSPAG
jgi:hypothetical protein